MTHEHTISLLYYGHCSHHACQTPWEKAFPAALAQALPAYVEVFLEHFFFREEKIMVLQLCHAHCSHGVDWEIEDKALVGVMLHRLCRSTSFSHHVSRMKGFKDSLHVPSILL